jgi:hypothetical protein
VQPSPEPAPDAVQPSAVVRPSARVAEVVQPSSAEAVAARPSAAAEPAARPSVAAAMAAQPSWVEVTVRPSSPVEAARPSWAGAMPELLALPAVLGALPHAPQTVAGRAAAQVAVEVLARPRQPALMARRHWVAALPRAAGLPEPREPSRQWPAAHRQRRVRWAPLFPGATHPVLALRSD